MAKILLAEDDGSLAYGLKYSLEREGYEVIHAPDCGSVYRLFSDDVSLILLDIMLPDGSGYDVCKEIRKTSSVPIIFLTACDSEVNIITGLDMGADDYIPKPFRLGELLSRVRAVLRRTAKKDINADEVQGLTLAELRLMNTLKANSGATLTRMQLLDKLWDGKGEFVDDNTLSVHISRLREKIGSDHIITVRGVGYKWQE
ncbi:MAG: response regulator transcription factor [Huintestinicola sp.]